MSQYKRIARFVIVGVSCYAVQFLLFHVLQDYLHAFMAGYCAFALSGQINFVASTLFTWRDRRGGPWLRVFRRWLGFNSSIMVMAAFNAVLVIAIVTVTWQWLAVLTATFITSGFTFVVNHFIVYGSAHVSSEKVRSRKVRNGILSTRAQRSRKPA